VVPTSSTLPGVLEGALLVRVMATEAGWTVSLPPTPPGWVLTVTICGAEREGEAAALARRGYRLLGGVPVRAQVLRTADILVPERMREVETRWWRSLLLLAQRVFDPRLGPVLVVLEDVLRHHAEAIDAA